MRLASARVEIEERTLTTTKTTTTAKFDESLLDQYVHQYQALSRRTKRDETLIAIIDDRQKKTKMHSLIY